MSTSLSRIDQIKNAWNTFQADESKKSVSEKIKESLVSPFYVAKGAAKSGLKLLESGIKLSPPGMLYEQLPEMKKMLTHFKGWSAQKEAEAARSRAVAKEVFKNPGKALDRLVNGVKDGVTKETVHFLKAPNSKKAEIVGEAGTDIALMFVGPGEVKALSQGTKTLQEVSLLEKAVLNSESLLGEKALLQGIANGVESSAVSKTLSSSAKIAQVMEGGVLQAIKTEKIPSLGFNPLGAIKKPVSEAVRASQIPSLESLSEAASKMDRNNITKAGRALQKHSDRVGSLFPKPPSKKPEILNRAGQKAVDEILFHPQSTVEMGYSKTLGKKVLDIRKPDGMGVRFDEQANFIGVLDP